MNVYAITVAAGPAALLRRSVDGGTTWTDLDSVSSGGFSPYGLWVSEDETVVVFAGIASTWYGMRIWKSVNGGVSFALVYDSGSATYKEAQSLCVSPEDTDYMWVCGRYGAVAKSTNGGTSWSEVAVVLGTNSQYLQGISFASNLIGWTAGSGHADARKIFKTTDGGSNWVEQEDTGVDMADVFAISENQAWALEKGAAGKLWKTIDGGTTWTGLPTARQYQGGRIYAIGTDKVWFTGRSVANLELVRSIDGGESFARVAVVDTGASGSEYRVPLHFPTEDIGFIGFYHSWSTNDGGQTLQQGGVLNLTSYAGTGSIYSGINLLFEVRSFDITGAEPADRTTEGTMIMAEEPLNFGVTPKEDDSNVKCIIFRVASFSKYSTVGNMRYYLYEYSEFDDGSSAFYADITDTWTQNKTPSQVKAGTPGTCPNSLPSANLTKIGGGDITGVGHADTSQYIYLVNTPGASEDTETKNFQYRVRFDYV